MYVFLSELKVQQNHGILLDRKLVVILYEKVLNKLLSFCFLYQFETGSKRKDENQVLFSSSFFKL